MSKPTPARAPLTDEAPPEVQPVPMSAGRPSWLALGAFVVVALLIGLTTGYALHGRVGDVPIGQSAIASTLAPPSQETSPTVPPTTLTGAWMCEPDPGAPQLGDPCPSAIEAIQAAVTLLGSEVTLAVIQPGPFLCGVLWPGVQSEPVCVGAFMAPGMFMHAWIAFSGTARVAAVSLDRALPSDTSPLASSGPWHASVEAFEVPPAVWVFPSSAGQSAYPTAVAACVALIDQPGLTWQLAVEIDRDQGSALALVSDEQIALCQSSRAPDRSGFADTTLGVGLHPTASPQALTYASSQAEAGARSPSLLVGRIPPGTATVRLGFADGSQQLASVAKGLWLAWLAVPADPTTIEALDAGGSVIGRLEDPTGIMPRG